MMRAALPVLLVAGCSFSGPRLSGGFDASPDASPDAPFGCPPQFSTLSGMPSNPHRYARSPADGWFNLRSVCEQSAPVTYLAIPDDAAELMGIAVLAAGTPFWVGINDQAVEGSYVRVRGNVPATFLPWANGQPDNAGAGEDCVSATATTFSDAACTNAYPAVCECEP